MKPVLSRPSRRLFAPVCALLLFGCETPPLPAHASTGPVAQKSLARAVLKEIAGDVKVKRAAGDDWVVAGEGYELQENDKVRTASGASATVRFANGSNVALGEDALISIAETRPKPGQDRSDLTVFKGRIDAQLDDASQQSLSVSTPAAQVRAGREIVFR